jgi:hypothetical protein
MVNYSYLCIIKITLNLLSIRQLGHSPEKVMKTRFIFTLSILALLAFSCQKECIRPESNTPTEMKCVEGIFRPAQQCGASAFTTLKSAGADYGSVEILNDAEQVYIITQMNADWFLADVKIFVGDANNIPRGNGGVIQLEEFPLQINHPGRVAEYTYTMNTANMGACVGVTVWARAVQMNMLGDEIASVDLWADGSQTLNGYSYQYCKGVCNIATMQTVSSN